MHRQVLAEELVAGRALHVGRLDIGAVAELEDVVAGLALEGEEPGVALGYADRLG